MQKISRLEQALLQKQAYQQKALIPFFTVGDPSPKHLPPHQIMESMVQAGADVLELGIPFSDPMADGPVIQKSSESALLNGMNLDVLFTEVELFRKKNQHTPLVLMGYANPIFQYGIERFAKTAQAAGVDGVLIVDMPHGFSQWQDIFDQHELASIYLITPTTSIERITALKTHAKGYIYYVSSRGVTGGQIQAVQLPDIEAQIQKIRNIIGLPVMVGFGIHDQESAKNLAKISDGVIIGSAIVKGLEAHFSNEQPQKSLNWLYAFLKDIHTAIND